MYQEIINQMKKKKEKQQDLADLLEVHRTQISRKITGYSDWSTDEIKLLCKHYNMKFEKLFRKEN